MFFKKPQKLSSIWVYFWKKICHQELWKFAQSSHMILTLLLFLSLPFCLSLFLSFFLSFFISLPFCLSHFFFSIPFICTWTWATKFQFIFWILCRLLDRDVPIFKIFANFLPHRFVCSKMATNDMFLFGRKWYFKTFLKMCHPLPLFRLFSSFRTNSTISYNK